MGNQNTPDLRPLLREFADIADERFASREFVRDQYEHVQAFFRPENFREADWEDFQEMGKQIHALTSHPVAYQKAFGDPNHDIDRYRRSFEYLARGDDPLPKRLDRVEKNEEPYGIKFLSESSLGELAGKLFADDYLMYNERSKEALGYLGLGPTEDGLSFGERFVQFTEAARPVVEAYKDVVGRRTDLPTHLEVDQFLSWIYGTQIGAEDAGEDDASEKKSTQNIWLIAPGEGAEHWDYWQEEGIISIGWQDLGGLLDYESEDAIEESEEWMSSTDAKACWEFSRVMKEGDVVFVKEGTTTILGVGVVTSEYRFLPEDRDETANQRSVRWVRTGRWDTRPRTFPRKDWSREKRESDGWRETPRVLPQKTLTEIGKYPPMTAELEILLGIDSKAEAGARDPLPIDQDALKRAVERVILPLTDQRTFREGKEAYLHTRKLPKGQKNLLPEHLKEAPRAAAKEALPDTSEANPLGWQELDRAQNAFDRAGEEEIRTHLTSLLYGDGPLEERIKTFLQWGQFEEAGKTVEINATVASYLLAMTRPALYAFYKPRTYRHAAKALLGPDSAYGAGAEAKRIFHASRFYGEVLRRMRRKWALPLRDLLDVHAAFYILSPGSKKYDVSWEALPEEGGSWIGEKAPNHFWWTYDPGRRDLRKLQEGGVKNLSLSPENGGPWTEVRKGDLIVAYGMHPERRVTGTFEVAAEDKTGQSGNRGVVVEKVQDITEGPGQETLGGLPELSDFHPPVAEAETPTEITEAEYQAIISAEPESFSLEKATEDLFYGPEAFQKWLGRLRKKKNLILQGPPGVGKTFVSKRLAYALMGEKAEGRIEMIQLHQSYAYEDFIRGYRPTEDEGFRLKNGVFFRFCERAKEDPDREYVFIIDEINRGNLSKVFGEIMMLVEVDKRGPEQAIQLSNRRGKDDSYGNRFYVPENVYLLGMMNTADRSLAMVDYALRRRFAFVEMEPRFGTERFRAHLRKQGAEGGLIGQIVTRLQSLNEEIADDDSLGEGFRIGHSYFCPEEGEHPDQDWYQEVITREIEPLLKEYWFDDQKRAESHVDDLKG